MSHNRLPPVRADHIIVVVAHGLSLTGSSRRLANEAPNLNTMVRIGRRCTLGEGCAPFSSNGLRELLLQPDNLFAGASANAYLSSLVIPWAGDAWLADHAAATAWSIVETGLRDWRGSWSDLFSAAPTLETAPEFDEAADFLTAQILNRFPGEATRIRSAIADEATAVADAWLVWITEAFLRNVWFASARSDRTFNVLIHPAPALLSRSMGEAGHRLGLAHLDALAGRLQMLLEHPLFADSLLLLVGDFVDPVYVEAAVGAVDPNVPCLMLGQAVDGLPPADLRFRDLAAWLQASFKASSASS